MQESHQSLSCLLHQDATHRLISFSLASGSVILEAELINRAHLSRPGKDSSPAAFCPPDMVYSEPDTDITVKSVQDSLAYDNKPGGVWEQVGWAQIIME